MKLQDHEFEITDKGLYEEFKIKNSNSNKKKKILLVIKNFKYFMILKRFNEYNNKKLNSNLKKKH